MMAWRAWLRRLRGRDVVPFREDRFWQAMAEQPGYSPVFFLSTGRSGTLFFTQLLAQDRRFVVAHNAAPELIAQSRVAYQCVQGGMDAMHRELLRQLLVVARQQVLDQCLRDGTTYVETNNRLTFFAPALLAMFPAARFVHLYRHPEAFVRSGLARRWYTGENSHDIGRIVPLAGTPAAEAWPGWNDVERIAWLWAETNRYIADFLDRVGPGLRCAMYFEQPTAEEVARVLGFCGAQVPADLGARVATPVNAQRYEGGQFSAELPENARAALLRQAAPLMQRLGMDR